ncbi:PHP domain-containing protein [Chloroflexota bacterium]
MSLKLDLHVHYHEAVGFVPLTNSMVAELIATVKARGLDGLAITDHNGYDTDIAYRVKEIVERDFNEETLIIPGQECDVGSEHVVELFLPNDRIFRFLAHPSYLPVNESIIDRIQGIEINNGQYGINKTAVREFAEKHNLLLLSNSDAHRLVRIGSFYNDIELDDILKRAVSR